MLAKEELPQVPFFLFDLDRAVSGEGGERGARDFLRETFFSSFEEQRKSKIKEAGGQAMERNKAEGKL